MIAERLPSEELATKTDVLALRGYMEARFEALTSDFKAELHRVEAAIYRWMLTFFATLWLGMAGMIVAIVLGG